MSRVCVRYIGQTQGKVAKRPTSMAGLLSVATDKLKLTRPATRIFSSKGDEYDVGDDDLIELVGDDHVLYFSCGEDFVPPTELRGEPNSLSILAMVRTGQKIVTALRGPFSSL